jgi:hypothetical protein
MTASGIRGREPGTVSVPGFRWSYRVPRCLLSLRLPLSLTLILRGVLVRDRSRDRPRDRSP